MIKTKLMVQPQKWQQWLLISLGLLSVGILEKGAVAESLCPSEIGAAIATVTEKPEFKRARWGILVQTLAGGEKLYGINEDKYFTVASNVKLLTTAAALRQLGPNFRLRTTAHASGEPPYLDSLTVLGRGDPSLTSQQLQQLAQQLKAQGVRHITKLIVDDSYFKGPLLNPSWELSDIWFYFAPPVNSLILNENAVILKLIPQASGQPVKLEWGDRIAASQWRVNNQTITAAAGSQGTIKFEGRFTSSELEVSGELASDSGESINAIAIPDPASYFVKSLRSILVAQGITVSQETIVREPANLPSGLELAFIDSPHLIDLVNKTNQESNNLFAEALLKILGSQSEEYETGVEVVKQSLIDLGVNPDSFILVDGSGLSRQNLVSPEALVQTLILMARTEGGRIYRNSLPVAGVGGTLKDRFTETAITGNLQGKTGTLTGVSVLSGYLDVPTYHTLAFSIVINHSHLSAREQREAIDKIVLLLFSLKNCPPS